MILGTVAVLYISGVFGTSVLNNLHLRYLRSLGKNVVLIHSIAGGGATGFVVTGKSGKKYIMTNGHVCTLEERGTLLGNYRNEDSIVTVVKRYQMNDLCVLTPPKDASNGFRIAKNYSLGQTAYVLGHPQLEPLSISVGELSDTIMISIMTKVNGLEKDCSGVTYTYHTEDISLMARLFGVKSFCTRILQANTSSIVISPGNSGSPVLDIWGAVIGVTFAANESGTRSYHVPLKDLRAFLEQL